MTIFTHALATNNYGPAKFVVATSAANGTHTTLASAMSVAVSGDTIFLRDSVTENVTLTPGVNITCYIGSELTPNVTITGKLTMSGAGTCTISGIRLQTNSDFAIVVSGSAASILNLENCYLNCSNNTGISFTTSSSSAQINLNNCTGNLGTTGIAYFASSSAGVITFNYCVFTNTGGSSTASTISAGSISAFNSSFTAPITTSGTAGIGLNFVNLNTAPQNVIALTHGGSGASSRGGSSIFVSGSAAAVSIGGSATFTMIQCEVNSTNANPVTGAGILDYSPIQFSGTGQGINTTTRNPQNFGTWIPTIVGTVAGTTTYTVQQGYYTIIGNLVYIEALITITAATGTGTAIIGSLPFTIKNLTNYDPIGTCEVASAAFTLPASNTATFFRGLPNTTTANIGTSGSGAVNNLQMANGSGSFIFSCLYQI